MVFSTQNNEVSWAVPAGFTAPLNKGLIPQSTLAGWATGANNPCLVNGTLYCLRNDLSQTVLWYNSALMKKWGYQVPATWEQYEALGQKVAAQHPGYLVGSAGDTFTPEIFMWASKCGANQITGPKSVTVNATGPECTRMASLLDTLIKNKSMSTSSVFSSDFDKNDAGKILMLPGPAWYGGALFQGWRPPRPTASSCTATRWPSGPGMRCRSLGQVDGLPERRDLLVAAQFRGLLVRRPRHHPVRGDPGRLRARDD